MRGMMQVVKLDIDFGSAFSGILVDGKDKLRALWASYSEQVMLTALVYIVLNSYRPLSSMYALCSQIDLCYYYCIYSRHDSNQL